MGTFGSVKGDEPGNKGRTFPPEPLTPDEVAAHHRRVLAPGPDRHPQPRAADAAVPVRAADLRGARAQAVRRRPGRGTPCRVLHGKGNKATVRGFHPTATDALARWIDTRKSLGLRNGPLFCTLDGGPLSPAVRAASCSAAWRPRPGSTSACTRTACGTRSPTSCAPPGSTWSSSPSCSATRRSRSRPATSTT